MQPSVFFSKDLFNLVGGCDTNLRYSLDLDLWLRMIKEKELHYLPFVFSRARLHGKSKTCLESEQFAIETYQGLKKYMHLVSFSTKLRIKGGYKRKLAAIACSEGLREYFDGNRAEALKSLKKACGMSWSILFYKNWLSLLLRLVLPQTMKRKIFNK